MCNNRVLILTLILFSARASTVIDDSKLLESILETGGYNMRERPYEYDNNGAAKPIIVRTSIYIYFLGNIMESQLEFETQLNIRHRWFDSRLSFRNANVSQPLWVVDSIKGESFFADNIWTPNLFIENGLSTELGALRRENVFVRISKLGSVQLNYRVKAKVLCNMALKRFPHDIQGCRLKLESWTLDSDELILEWESANPLEVNNFIIPGFDLKNYNTFATNSCYSENFPSPRNDLGDTSGLFNEIPCTDTARKTFSTISVSFTLERQVGHYVLDYYLPSILLVAMSWVSFWLDPSAVPGRTTLGTSTWLTFITLTHNTGTNQLPRVSYIKFLDIWFLGCTLFIFSSLLEFAVVNSISRRKETVAVKGVNVRSMLPAAASVFATPAVSRRNSITDNGSTKGGSKRSSLKSLKSLKSSKTEPDLRRHSFAFSLPSYKGPDSDSLSSRDSLGSRLTVNDHTSLIINHLEPNKDFTEVSIPVPIVPLNGEKSKDNDETNSTTERRLSNVSTLSSHFMDQFDHMTSQEIAVWLDMKARFVFPLLFLLFNIIYWFFAFRVDCLIKSCGEVDSIPF